jgi:hypothetical protein
MTDLWAVRTAVLELLTDPAEAAGAKVFDGQRKVGATPKLFLVVGADSDDPFEAPDDVVDTLAGSARQERAREGPGDWRQETGDVLCTIVAWDGGTLFGPLRAKVQTVLDACEAALLATPELAAADLVGAGAELGEIRLWERRSKDGSAVGVVFTVTYQSILT